MLLKSYIYRKGKVFLNDCTKRLRAYFMLNRRVLAETEFLDLDVSNIQICRTKLHDSTCS